MNCQEVLGWELFNQHFLHHGDFAGVGQLVLKVFPRFVHGQRLISAGIHVRLLRAALAHGFFVLNTVRVTDELT